MQPFSIFTTISQGFSEAMRIFMPSWIRNSGAQEIVIAQLSGDTWMENIVQRCDRLAECVTKAATTGARLLSLDADCFVLDSLAGGFSDNHAFSVTRWPKINCGVMWFNTACHPGPADWPTFLSTTLDQIRNLCLSADPPRGACDQWIWERRLQEIPGCVMSLNAEEWNLCDGIDSHWREQLQSRRVRVAHVKGRGDWTGQAGRRIALVRELFPERV